MVCGFGTLFEFQPENKIAPEFSVEVEVERAVHPPSSASCMTKFRH
jgi:hypothetical protein